MQRVELRRVDFVRNPNALELVKKSGLPVACVGVEPGWIFSSKGEEQERLFAVMRETCQNAVALGCPTLMSAIGPGTASLDEAIANIARAGVKDSVVPMIMTSEEAAKGWNQPIRLLWIDGDHRYEPAKLDFTLWEPFLVEGGILALHLVEAGPAAGLGEDPPAGEGVDEHRRVDAVAQQCESQIGARLCTQLAVEALEWTTEDDPRYVSAIIARLQERLVSRQIADIKSKVQRMSPLEDAEEYNALFGDMVALEGYRKALLDQAMGTTL